MPHSKVDYNSLAHRYNERYRGRPLSGVAAALDPLRGGRVLEVGCGTGHWLRAEDFGLDFHFELARQADAHVSCGDAAALPFRDSSFDLVFTVNAIHHFADQRRFIHEARRTLRRGGALATVGMSPRMQRSQWWIYDYFEGTYARDLERFPSWGTLVDWSHEAGFRCVEWRVAEVVHGARRGAEIFDDPFLPKHSASQLALLTDDEYQAGLARIRAAVECDPDVVFRWELILGLLVVR